MRRLLNLVRWRKLDRRLDEEIQLHVEMLIAEFVRKGMTPADAEREARRQFGGVVAAKEAHRDARGLTWLSAFVTDVRIGARLLRRRPLLTLVAVLSLGLGVGLNVAAFSFVDAGLLRPLDVPDSAALLRIFSVSKGSRQQGLSLLEFRTLQRESKTVSDWSAIVESSAAVRTNELSTSRVTSIAFVNAAFFRGLHVPITLGRDFRDDEDGAQALREPVALVTEAFWETRLGRRDDVVGRTIRIKGVDVAVVGVLPGSFGGVLRFAAPEIYLPLGAARTVAVDPEFLDDPKRRLFIVSGRAASGKTIAEIQTEAAAIAKHLESEYPDSNRDRVISALTETEATRARQSGDFRMGMFLMGLTALVLLIACVNVANLLMGRARERSREVAVRLAIGAGRGRLVRQMLTESALLAFAGGVVAIGLGVLGILYLRSLEPPPAEVMRPPAIRLDTRVFLYTMAVSIGSLFLFGLVPAWKATRVDLIDTIKGNITTSSKRFLGRYALVAIQTALAAMLTVAAGFCAYSFQNGMRQGPGLRVDGVLTMQLTPSMIQYPETKTRAFYEQLQERVRAIPDVRSVSLARTTLMTKRDHVELVVIPGFEPRPDATATQVDAEIVDVGYFDTMAIPIVAGRTFDRRDTKTSPLVAIVNQRFVERYFPGKDPLGKTIHRDRRNGPLVTIVGVSRNVRKHSVIEQIWPMLYLPFAQSSYNDMVLYVETRGDAAALAAPVQNAIRSLEPDMPVSRVFTIRNLYETQGQLAARLMSQVVGFTGFLGTAMAMIGLYAVIAYSVNQRKREIGIRMAVGASPGSVLSLYLRRGLMVCATGIVVGLFLAVPITRVLDEPMSAVRPNNVELFGGAALCLAAAGFLASYLPSRRASRVDPIETLRYE